MEALRDQERQAARRHASNPILHFPSRRKMQAEKDKKLDKIIRDLERTWGKDD